MSAAELLSRPADELPAFDAVEPTAFLNDPLLPSHFALVEPSAFAAACSEALWGSDGPRN